MEPGRSLKMFIFVIAATNSGPFNGASAKLKNIDKNTHFKLAAVHDLTNISEFAGAWAQTGAQSR
jgi:hypothetical protein